jgi:hypothetical protein
MSPELFKIYLLEVSEDINNIMEDLNVPVLNDVYISHLGLWADDLVLSAVDTETLQKLMDKVHRFCDVWGISVNLSKRAIMIFNKCGRQPLVSHKFKYGDTSIPSALTHCYL